MSVKNYFEPEHVFKNYLVFKRVLRVLTISDKKLNVSKYCPIYIAKIYIHP